MSSATSCQVSSPHIRCVSTLHCPLKVLVDLGKTHVDPVMVGTCGVDNLQPQPQMTMRQIEDLTAGLALAKVIMLCSIARRIHITQTLTLVSIGEDVLCPSLEHP